MTGFPPARDISQRMSPALEHSPVELKSLIALQSRFSMQPELRQLFTRLGTTPSIVVFADCTKLPNSRPVGAPQYKPIAARLSRLAKISHGPIIQPRFVGQTSTSLGWTF